MQLMKNIQATLTAIVAAAAVLTAATGCNGILAGVYDEPPAEEPTVPTGELYIDASSWSQWHYIHLPSLVEKLADDSSYNPAQAWQSYSIPMEPVEADAASKAGIYTYWYDIFGQGLTNNEFREYMATAAQPEPPQWTFAVHRNNVRTNGATVAPTSFETLDDIPSDKTFVNALTFEADSWSENEVWCDQSRMLLGMIGNQGINVNKVLSGWLTVRIPPIPPAFGLNAGVFILKLADGTLAALQLADYIGPDGTKCCLTIKYRYPL